MKKIISLFTAMFLTFMMGSAFASMTGAITDTGITAEVKTLLIEKEMFNAQTQLNPLDVNVETTDGVVLLTGHVKDEQQKAKAGEIAQSAKGVKSVDNQLVIKP